MRADPRSKKSSLSPIGKPTYKGTEKDKSSKRLIERVEKAIS